MRFGRVGLVVVVVGLASACGGDGGDSLSVSEFRDKAEAICREIEESDVRPPSDFSDVGRFADEFIDEIDKSTSDMHALDPPEEFQARWQQYLEVLDDLASRIHEFRDDIDGATREEVARLGREFQADIQQLEARGHAIERQLGLDECVD